MPIELLKPIQVAQEPARVAQHARDHVTWLVDNAVACDALLDRVDGAARDIWITQLAFDADFVVHAGEASETGGDRTLLDALLAAARRGVRVCVLVNESLLLDTAEPLRQHLRNIGGAEGIEVRGISRFPQLLHAKMVIVDEEWVLLLGSPFVNGYWDDATHRPVDARRGARELAGRPVHDVSLALRGPVVHDVAAVFAELWNSGSVGPEDAALQPVPVGPPRLHERQDLRLVRTMPRATVASAPQGRTEILAELLRGIRRARRFIYIEHQYLSSAAVIAAIAGVLRERPLLQVIVVLNQNPDVTAYRGWQNQRLRDARLLGHPRVGVFALWSAQRAGGASAPIVSQLFIHSKVVIVDDCWASVGSANLDGVSLHSYGADFTSRLGERVFRDVRNVDVNVVIESASGTADERIRELRVLLWAEHLRADPASRALQLGGRDALEMWRRRASQDAATLDAVAPLPAGSTTLLLPYSQRSKPREQLADAGVAGAGRLELAFDPGWLERHCSPSWVRNMFA